MESYILALSPLPRSQAKAWLQRSAQMSSNGSGSCFACFLLSLQKGMGYSLFVRIEASGSALMNLPSFARPTSVSDVLQDLPGYCPGERAGRCLQDELTGLWPFPGEDFAPLEVLACWAGTPTNRCLRNDILCSCPGCRDCEDGKAGNGFVPLPVLPPVPPQAAASSSRPVTLRWHTLFVKS